MLGGGTELHLKLELLQAGPGHSRRGAALLNVLGLSAEAHSRGVTAISAGNHAIAVAFAAAPQAGVSAKVVMIATGQSAPGCPLPLLRRGDRVRAGCARGLRGG